MWVQESLSCSQQTGGMCGVPRPTSSYFSVGLNKPPAYPATLALVSHSASSGREWQTLGRLEFPVLGTQQVDQGVWQGDGQAASRWALWILLKRFLRLGEQEGVATAVPAPLSIEQPLCPSARVPCCSVSHGWENWGGHRAIGEAIPAFWNSFW